MEAEGGDGTRCEHWDSTVFGNELMTAWRGEGEDPLSIVSIRAIEELGYDVDAGQADDFELVGLEADTGTR